MVIAYFLLINLINTVAFATELGENMNGKLISSIDLVPLIHQHDLTFAAPDKELTEFGAIYKYKNLSSSSTLFIQVALYQSMDLAVQRVEDQKMMVSIGPDVSDQSVGDDYIEWTGKDSQKGGILYRRMNAVFHISGKIEFNRKKAVIIFIDHAITAQNKTISFSDSLPKIEVTLRGFKNPAIAHAGSKLSWPVDTSGHALSGLEPGVSNVHSVMDGKNNLLTYYAGHEAGDDVIKVLIWQPGNLFTIHPFKIKVVE